MRQSIFDIENRIDIQKEFNKLIETLCNEKTMLINGEFSSYFRFINKYVFNLWEYRDTFIDLGDYLDHIGINDFIINNTKEINEPEFLNFLEFLININEVSERIDDRKICYVDIKTKNIISHNIPIILEKLNYTTYNDQDKIKIRKRNADVDSVLNIVPLDISSYLLSYYDIRNNNLEIKREILKKLDLFIESNKADFKQCGKELYNSIQSIVNGLGVNHPIETKKQALSNDELMTWYDNCFLLILHLFRENEIKLIEQKRKSFFC